MDEFQLKIKSQIKKELIEHYDTLKFDLDLKVQTILNKNKNKKKKKKLVSQNTFLINQIDRVFESNLNDVNDFFQNFYKHPVILDENETQSKKRKLNDVFTTEFNDIDYHNETKLKEEIKRKALKSYLICINHREYSKIGLHLEFEWYIDRNQINFIK